MSRGRLRRGVGERFWRLEGAESESLIGEVRKRPSLWDDRAEDFKHPKVTNRMWEEVGEALNMPGDEMKKKWKNMKDKYRKTLQESMVCKKGKPLPKPWRFASLMEFTKEGLLPSVLQAASGETYGVEDGVPGEPGDYSETPEDPAAPDQTFLGDFPSPAAPDQTFPGDFPRTSHRPATTLVMSRRRQTESEFDYEPGPAPKRYERSPAQMTFMPAKETKAEPDDDYYFLMSLHPFLKPLQAFDKLDLRARLLSQVMETYRQHQQRSGEDQSHVAICDAVQLEPNTLLHYELPEEHKADLRQQMMQ